MMKLIHLFSLSLIVLASCGAPKPQKTAETKETKVEPFTIPEIPTMLNTPEERAQFITLHYWDNFNFSDTSLISHPEITEQAFANYVNLLPHSPNYKEGIETMMKKAEADSAMFAHFASMAEKYFYDPNSPFRNEDFYVSTLNVILKSEKVDEWNKVRPAYQLGMAMKNRVGEKATMFPQLAKSKGELILLFFHNPECENCKEIKEYIKTKELDKKVTLLMVNPDENKGLEELYDLRAIPTLYLLNKEKTVLLKDAVIGQVEEYLLKK